MILTMGDGTMATSLRGPLSDKEILEGKIAMDTLLLKIEEEQGYKRVHDRIEELKCNLRNYNEELSQMDKIEDTNVKHRRTKSFRWNWR